MNNKHLNSEKNINNKYFKLKLGTTNCVNPQAIYIEGRTFLQPIYDKDDYMEDLNNIKYDLRKVIRKSISEKDGLFMPNEYILDFDVANSGMIKNKKSLLTIQIFLKQKNDLKFKDLFALSNKMINEMLNNFSDEITKRNFSLSKTRK